ncbi:MAG: hypothetical protein AAFQ58_09460 [Pseudomonadota bacterium]
MLNKDLLIYGIPALFLTLSVAPPSHAQQAAAVSSAIVDVAQIEAFVEANLAYCRDAPAGSFPAAKRAVDQWHAVNATQFLWSWIDKEPQIAAAFFSIKSELRAELEEVLKNRGTTRAAEWCASLSDMLQQDAWNLNKNYAAELRALEAFALEFDEDAQVSRLQQGVALPPLAPTSLSAALAAGYDPEKVPLPGEFRCYDEEVVFAGHAHLVVQIPEAGVYRSSFGNGRWSVDEDGEIVWTTGPFAEARSFVAFEDYGQRMTLRSVKRNSQYSRYECYQSGAADDYVTIAAYLTTPQVGRYQCVNVETGERAPFEILPGLKYRFANEVGSFLVSDVIDQASGTVDWVSGPLTGEKSFYSEEVRSGLREFSISSSDGRALGGFVYSSSTLSLACEGRGEPVQIALYGSDPAPPVPAGTQAISGQFYRFEQTFNGTFSAYEPQVYTFRPDGYVFIGPPGPNAAKDCDRTRPNGLPVCASYRIIGNQIGILEEGDETVHQFAITGTAPTLDGEPMRPVEPAAQTSLDGHFWANYFWSSGFCGAFSACSSTYIEWNYVFATDGRFQFSEDSQFLASMNSSISNTNMAKNAADANQGRYEIEGNTINFAYDNGVVTSHFYLELEDGSFMIDEEHYTRKDSTDK